MDTRPYEIRTEIGIEMKTGITVLVVVATIATTSGKTNIMKVPQETKLGARNVAAQITPYRAASITSKQDTNALVATVRYDGQGRII